MKLHMITKMAQTTLITVGIASLSACYKVSGTVEVAKPFQVKTKNIFTGEKLVTIGTGQQKASITFNEKTAKLKLTNDQGKKVTASLDLPASFNLPSNGTFTLNSKATGQPFDVDGKVSTTSSHSESKRYTVHCRIPVGKEYVCHYVKIIDKDKDGKVIGSHTEKRCKWEERFIPGIEVRRNYVSSRTTTIEASVSESGSATANADFTGYDYSQWSGSEVVVPCGRP